MATSCEPVDLLSCEEIYDMIGSPAFYGGLVDHRAGTINPMAYCRGITTGTLFGQSLAQLLTGMDPKDLPLPVTKPEAAPRRYFMTKFYDLGFTANQIWKEF